MAISTNVLTVTGRLGGDPESKQVGSKDLASFRIAVSQGGRDGQENPMWLKINVWGKQAPACAMYLSKGSKVAITGRLDVRTYAKKDGTEGTSVEVSANSVEFLDSKNQSDAARPDVDELPF